MIHLKLTICLSIIQPVLPLILEGNYICLARLHDCLRFKKNILSFDELSGWLSIFKSTNWLSAICRFIHLFSPFLYLLFIVAGSNVFLKPFRYCLSYSRCLWINKHIYFFKAVKKYSYFPQDFKKLYLLHIWTPCMCLDNNCFHDN